VSTRLPVKVKASIALALFSVTIIILLVAHVFGSLDTTIDRSMTKSGQTIAGLAALNMKNVVQSTDSNALETAAYELISTYHLAYLKAIDINGDTIIEKGDANALSKPFSANNDVSDTTDGIYHVSAPIEAEGTLLGYVQLGIDVTALNNDIGRSKYLTLILALVALILFALSAFFIGAFLRHLRRQLKYGALKIEAAVRGDSFHQASLPPTNAKHRISEVSLVINQLVEVVKKEVSQIHSREKEQHEQYAQLEEKAANKAAGLYQIRFQLQAANKELKEAQTQLLQAEKMAALGQLAAGVAHEINNPIGFVSSNIDTLREYVATYQMLYTHIDLLLKQDAEEERNKVLGEIKDMLGHLDMNFINTDISELLTDSNEGLHRVDEIIKGLKQFSRIDSDEEQLYNLNDCIRTTLAMVNNQLKYICTVETQLGQIPQISMNVGKISQVVTNLLINAGQAIESSGEMGTITITTKVVQDNIELSIADTGCGIEPAHLDKLFNPFFTTKPEGQGTGLGLSISFGIAQEHGGTLNVTSTEGEGSCFILTLPLKRDNNDEA